MFHGLYCLFLIVLALATAIVACLATCATCCIAAIPYIGTVILLPVFVLLETKLGLVSGGIADVGGLLVIIALLGMLVGVLRYTGKLDAEVAR